MTTGLIPALHLSSGELQLNSRRFAGGHSQTRRALVVAEVALALMLLVSAGLLLRSMQRLSVVDPGFQSSHLLTMQVQSSGHQFDNLSSSPGAGDNVRRRFFKQALAAVRRVPGVEQAAFTSLLPLSDDPPWISTYGSRFESEDPQGGRNVFRYAVSPDYCQTMGIPLRSGRFLSEHDIAGAPQAALISLSLAKRQFPGQDVVGKRLRVGPSDWPWYTVVGVVGDVKQTSLAIDQPDAVYIPAEQTWFADDTLSFVVRTRVPGLELASAVRNAIWSVDKDQPIVRVATMDNLLAVSEAERHFVLILFEAFGIVSLALTAVGISGVLAGGVAERTREIGVRTALGASRTDILAVTSLLFGVSRLDPITYIGVIALLGVVSGIACWMPAWRAARVDPSITLRAE